MATTVGGLPSLGFALSSTSIYTPLGASGIPFIPRLEQAAFHLYPAWSKRHSIYTPLGASGIPFIATPARNGADSGRFVEVFKGGQAAFHLYPAWSKRHSIYTPLGASGIPFIPRLEQAANLKLPPSPASRTPGVRVVLN
jgi:hypothetical protein